MTRQLDYQPLLTPAEVAAMFGEVAAMFGVDPRTVTRWAKTGRLASVRTLGGHRRYSVTEVWELLNGSRTPRQRQAGGTS